MDKTDKIASLAADSTLSKALQAAAEAALKAGELIRRNFGKPHQIRHKGKIDIVTETDLASEKVIIEILKNHLPESTVLAEESHADYSSIPRGPLWIIDPLDGTTNFAHGFPYFGVSIAYAFDGKVHAGLIYCPMQDEMFFSSKNGGAFMNGEKITVSETSTLHHALVGTGFPYDIDRNLEQVVANIRNILPQVQDIRRAGAAALDLAYVACGRLDAFWEMDLKPWDTAAGQIIVTEAGGTLTNFTGGHFSPFIPEVLASNRHIHDKILPLLEKAYPR